MPDSLGYRHKWGLLVPARNTACEPELHAAVPDGITVHTSRVMRAGPAVWASDTAQHAMAQAIRDAEPAAIEGLLQAEVDYLISGVGGFSVPRAEHEVIARRYEELSGLRVATSSRAFEAALQAIGARSLAVLTPRLPDSGIISGGYWEEAGYTVTAGRGMGCTSAADIAAVTPAQLDAALDELAATRPDTILLTGSDFPFQARLDATEARLGIPLLNLNTVLCWYALRDNGFDDRLPGLGMLLRDH